jgi:hypothetical protein
MQLYQDKYFRVTLYKQLFEAAAATTTKVAKCTNGFERDGQSLAVLH